MAIGLVLSTIVLHAQRREMSLAERSSDEAYAPFLLPSLREPSTYANDTDKPAAGLGVVPIFEHPVLLTPGLETGDPVKRDIAPNHRPVKTPASTPTPHLSPAFHKTIPNLPLPSALPVIEGPEVTYEDILDGLQLGLSAILDSDVDFWVKEVVGASACRFLADIAALGKLRQK